MNHNNADEIDLLELLQSLWNGKWLICGMSAAALAIGGAYVAMTPNKFDASLIFSPINSTAAQEYQELNEVGFFEISPASLMNLMSDVLIERQTITETIKSTGLIERSNFSSDDEYDLEARRVAFGISIQRDEDLTENSAETADAALRRASWNLKISGDNLDLTQEFLVSAIQATEEVARARLIDRFNRRVEATIRSQSNTIEDTERAISNAFDDYDVRLSDRLEFLREQAQIARALNIARNTLEVTSFTQGNSILANVNADTPFYMRGYEAIEKEIELLQSRSEPDAFIPNLREMQNSIRSILQDPTLDRARAAFEASPVLDPMRFTAAQFDIAALEVTYHKKTSLILALSLVLGGFLGMVIVLFRSAIKARQSSSH